MRQFFIYSLPRSGTAWLSMFLTSKDSYCYHEPMADNALWRLSQRQELSVGAIDTGAFYRPDKVKSELPKARCYVLFRESADIQKSLDKAGLPFNAAEESGRLKNVTQNMPIIEYDLLTDVHYLKDLWIDVIGTAFDRERAEAFVGMNIQRDMKKFFTERAHLPNPLRCH